MGAFRTDSAAGTPGPSQSVRKYTNLAPRGGDRAGERYDSTMAERRALTAIMATALALMLLAACGNSGNGGNTPQKVQAALRNTAKQSGVQVTLSSKPASPHSPITEARLSRRPRNRPSSTASWP